MNKDELKKKIEDILEEYNFETDDGEGWILDTEEMADALIAAGIGDVKTAQEIGASATAMAVLEAAKAEHRAARAERALYKACKDIKDICEYLVKFGGTGVITIESYAPEQSEPSAYIDRAEKELAEEGKDGKLE